MRALVVDDSRAIRTVLRKMLVATGFDVVEAGHGREALDVLAAEPRLDLALVDWNMPEMTGIELVRAVRAVPSYANLRICMVTTETEMERMVEAFEAGADEYLMKPFTPEAVVDKMAILGLTVPAL